MRKINRLSVLVGAVSLLALAASVVAITPRVTSAGGPGGEDAEDEERVAPGTIDDGAELLPQAGITLDAAIAAAQVRVSGDIGEVDVEDYKGTLVFNIDVGSDDVKVDAQTGEVLAVAKD